MVLVSIDFVTFVLPCITVFFKSCSVDRGLTALTKKFRSISA